MDEASKKGIYKARLQGSKKDSNKQMLQHLKQGIYKAMNKC